MRGPKHHRRRTFACPECGTERAISWNPKLRRFKARQYRCLNDGCGFVGPRGAWDDPFDH